MNFKPTKWKVVISLIISSLVLVNLLFLIYLDGPMCPYVCKAEVCVALVAYECSIFEFAFINLKYLLLFWAILFVITYFIYSLFQKKY